MKLYKWYTGVVDGNFINEDDFESKTTRFIFHFKRETLEQAEKDFEKQKFP